MSRNNMMAATHPAYSFPGYTCFCGHKSETTKLHDQHVIESHADNPNRIADIVSSRTWDRWERQGKVPPFDTLDRSACAASATPYRSKTTG